MVRFAINFAILLHSFHENSILEGGQKLVKTLEGMGLHVAPVKDNLVDELWKNRPPLQSKGVSVALIMYACRSDFSCLSVAGL